FRNFQLLLHHVDRFLLHPRHEVHFFLRQFPKPLVIDVATVDRQDRARFEPQGPRHLDLAGLALGHHPEREVPADGRYPSWSSSRCSLMAPFVCLNFAQSNMLTDRSMMLPSRLISLFLKRNFFLRPPWLATSSWHLSSVCSNTDWYNCHGRCSLA